MFFHYLSGKNIMIENDKARVVRMMPPQEVSFMLLESSIILLESSIMFLVSSIMLLESSVMLSESIYHTGITYDDYHLCSSYFYSTGNW